MPRNSNSQTRRPWECESESLGGVWEPIAQGQKKQCPRKQKHVYVILYVPLGGV